MPTQRPAPFLTLEDPNAKIKGSRDPLGVYRRTFGPLVRGPNLDFKDGDTTVRIPISRTAHLLLALAVGLSTPVRAQAQKNEPVIGSWEGKLDVGGGNQLTLRFNVALDEDGALTGTMDSPDQGANGLPLTYVVSAWRCRHAETTGRRDRNRLLGEDGRRS